MITWDHFVIHLASVSLSGGLSGHEGIAEGAADGGRWGAARIAPGFGDLNQGSVGDRLCYC